jgi:hypothetical protein
LNTENNNIYKELLPLFLSVIKSFTSTEEIQ